MPAATTRDATEVIRLWEGATPPTTIDGMPDEIEYPVTVGVAKGTTFIRNISDPTLTVFGPTAPTNHRGVIVAPGGGWTINAWSHEGLDVADWLTGLGYTAFLLKYRVQRSSSDNAKFEARWNSADAAADADARAAQPVPKAAKPTAISDLVDTDSYHAARAAAADDGRRAIELVRQHADRFDLDGARLGLLGFSAGAFLGVDVALDPRADQLAWIAPIYGGETRGAPVPADAPPLFTAVAQDDSLVRIVEGLHADWTDAGRPAELHAFARGGHGFGMVRQGLPSDRWTDLFLAWLDDLS